jgi:hypothetical protein
MLLLFTGLYFGLDQQSTDSDTRYESVRMLLMGGVLLVIVQSGLRVFFMRLVAVPAPKKMAKGARQVQMVEQGFDDKTKATRLGVSGTKVVQEWKRVAVQSEYEGEEGGRHYGTARVDVGEIEEMSGGNLREGGLEGGAEGEEGGEEGGEEVGEEGGGDEEGAWGNGSIVSDELAQEREREGEQQEREEREERAAEAQFEAEEVAEAELRKVWSFFVSDFLLTIALVVLLPAYVHLTMAKASEEATLAAVFLLSQLALILLALSCQPQYVSRALAVALVVVPVLVAAPVYQYFEGSQPMHGLLLSLSIGMPTLEICVLSEGAAVFLLVVTAVLVPLYMHGELDVTSQEIVLAFMLVLAVFALLMLALRVYVATKDREKYPHFTRVVGKGAGAAVGAAIGAAVGASVGVAVGCHPKGEHELNTQGWQLSSADTPTGAPTAAPTFEGINCSRTGAAVGGMLGATICMFVGALIGATAMFLRQKANRERQEKEGKEEVDEITVVVPFSAVLLLVMSGLPLFVIIPIYMAIDPSRPLRAFLLFLALALPFFPITAGGVGIVYDSFADKVVYKLVGIFFFIFGLFVPVVVLLPIYLYASLGDTVNDILLMLMFLPGVCCYLGKTHPPYILPPAPTCTSYSALLTPSATSPTGLILSDLYNDYRRQIFGAFAMVFVTGLIVWTASQMGTIDLQTSSEEDKFVLLAMFSSTISVPVTVMLRNFKTHFRMYSWYTAYVLMVSSPEVQRLTCDPYNY